MMVHVYEDWEIAEMKESIEWTGYEKFEIEDMKESLVWLGEDLDQICDEDAEMALEKADEYGDFHYKWMEDSEGLEFDDYVLKHRGYPFSENVVI